MASSVANPASAASEPEYHFRGNPQSLGAVDLWIFPSGAKGSRRVVLQHQTIADADKERPAITTRYIGALRLSGGVKWDASGGFVPMVINWTHIADKLDDPYLVPATKATTLKAKKIDKRNGPPCELREQLLSSGSGRSQTGSGFHRPVNVGTVFINEAKGVVLARVTGHTFVPEKDLSLARADQSSAKISALQEEIFDAEREEE